jgi:hypothetical protein
VLLLSVSDLSILPYAGASEQDLDACLSKKNRDIPTQELRGTGGDGIMPQSFVMEAMMLAVHGQLLLPEHPVEYVIPYTTIQELYELKDMVEPIMGDPEDDVHVKLMIGELIGFFEDPFNSKKLERALQMPWRKSPPLPINEDVTLTVINAIEQAEYGEGLDPIETELVLTAIREKIPLLTDQLEFLDTIVNAAIPIKVYDIEDFEFAVDGDNLL